MAFFPADVVAEILSRLPVKALLRFRSVCKIWCAFIDSDYFIKLHLHRSKNNRQIIRTTYSTGFVDTISLDDLLDVAGKELDYPLVPEILDVPGKKGDTVGSVSCNGLVLEWAYNGSGYHAYIAISNLFTRKCQTLPPSQDKLDFRFSGGYKVYRLCFGYDAANDDYKVVKLNYIKFKDGGLKWDVQVYSLKSNSWRTIKDFPYEICFFRASDGVLAHGALHFVLATNPEEESHFVSVAAFDLATEETRLLPLLDVGGGNIVYMNLVALEGSLCVVAYEKIDGSDRKFLGVWVMKDYGVGESWNKLLSPAQLSVMGSFHKVFPLAYSKNGCEVLLLQDGKEFIWFDLENNAARKIQVCSLSSTFQAHVFVQSLVPLGYGGKTNPKKRSVRDMNKKQKKKLGIKRNRGVIEP